MRISTTTPRRGTSLMVRGSSESMNLRRNSPSLSRHAQDQRQRSLKANSQQDTPPFLTPAGSNNLLANSDHQLQRDALDAHRKSSGSSGASRYAMISARQSANELNLCESQAALDELEAVRFSAV